MGAVPGQAGISLALGSPWLSSSRYWHPEHRVQTSARGAVFPQEMQIHSLNLVTPWFHHTATPFLDLLCVCLRLSVRETFPTSIQEEALLQRGEGRAEWSCSQR